MEQEIENGMLLVKLPIELKREYKKKCIDKNISMKDEITAHIKKVVK